MRHVRRVATAVLAATALPATAAASPPPLSAEREPVPIASQVGSGDFGRWIVDRFGLPAYRYEIDHTANPIARQAALGGSTDAWNLVGNSHIKADAHVGGRIEFWSQDRLAQWANDADPSSDHHSGGWGYLVADGEVHSTMYEDQPPEMRRPRTFGAGYFRRSTRAAGIEVREHVYAPFGDAPLVLHDVTLTNTGPSRRSATWWEYWDVNPVVLGNAELAIDPTRLIRGTGPARYDEALKTLSVAQAPLRGDSDPLSIFAAAVEAPVAGFETTTARFFGAGDRRRPEAVAADSASSALAPATPGLVPGGTLFALRSPVKLRPGRSVTLRYAYGMAHPGEIPGLVAKYRRARDPLARSARHWARYVPQARVGGRRLSWLSRELQWGAHMVKGNSMYEELCGTHVVTQGGYYQFASGANAATRDPLEHILPMVYIDPRLARETIVWALRLQNRNGSLPYAAAALCKRATLDSLGFEVANELNFWLMLAVIEYVEATRDFAFLGRHVRFADGGSATVWEHLVASHRHQEQVIGRGPRGGYNTGLQGDTHDLTTILMQVTESISAAGNFAYIYPALADLAARRGDHAFARALRADGAELAAFVRSEWQPRGWYARAYTLLGKIGVGTIYGSAQYWPLLAGIPTDEQANALVANVRRYLDGIGAPPELRGPNRIGPTELPSVRDPGVSEASLQYPGRDTWWFVDGPAVWALARNADRLDAGRAYAWDVFERLTLANHAEEFPTRWSGVITGDDTCEHFSNDDPGVCGIIPGVVPGPLLFDYNTQITHPHAWVLFMALKLAGLEPSPRGYEIRPALPQRRFAIRTEVAGLEYTRRRVRGYVRPAQGGKLLLRVEPPRGRSPRKATVWVEGEARRSRAVRGDVVFRLPARAGRAADWAIGFAR